jgi:hypothetical protein
MQILVKGTKSKRLKAKIQDAVNFYGRRLMSKKVRDKLKIFVDVDTRQNHRKDCFGECDPLGRNPQTGLKEFRIYVVHRPQAISKLKNNIFRTLAHEMVHLKQYTTGELGAYLVATRSNSGKALTNTRWKGTLYKTREDDSDDNEYYDAPWEIEAYGREVGLYRRWRKSRGEDTEE